MIVPDPVHEQFIESGENLIFEYVISNKGEDQLHGKRTAVQHFCFHYIDGAIRLQSISDISSLKPPSVV